MRHGPLIDDSTPNSTRSSTSDSGTVLGFCGSWAGSMTASGNRKSAWARTAEADGDDGDEREGPQRPAHLVGERGGRSSSVAAGLGAGQEAEADGEQHQHGHAAGHLGGFGTLMPAMAATGSGKSRPSAGA